MSKWQTMSEPAPPSLRGRRQAYQKAKLSATESLLATTIAGMKIGNSAKTRFSGLLAGGKMPHPARPGPLFSTYGVSARHLRFWRENEHSPRKLCRPGVPAGCCAEDAAKQRPGRVRSLPWPPGWPGSCCAYCNRCSGRRALRRPAGGNLLKDRSFPSDRIDTGTTEPRQITRRARHGRWPRPPLDNPLPCLRVGSVREKVSPWSFISRRSPYPSQETCVSLV